MIIRRDSITPREARSKLREPNNRQDDLFVSFCISLGVLNSNFKTTQPGDIKRIINSEPKAKFGTRQFGQGSAPKSKYKESLQISRVLPEKQFNPMNKTDIGSGTKLGRGIPLGRFVATQSLAQATLNDFPNLDDRKRLARHYYMFGLMMTGFMNLRDRFGTDYSISVTEGLYLPETTETLTSGGIKELASKGRACVFEVIDQAGNNAPEKTFELAAYWKDNHLFDKLIMSYDTMDPSVDFTAQIVVTMPEIAENFTGSFARKVSTEFNFKLLIDNAIAECSV